MVLIYIEKNSTNFEAFVLRNCPKKKESKLYVRKTAHVSPRADSNWCHMVFVRCWPILRELFCMMLNTIFICTLFNRRKHHTHEIAQNGNQILNINHKHIYVFTRWMHETFLARLTRPLNMIFLTRNVRDGKIISCN